MADTLKLYVSAANDLPDERELIGQMVTEIPVTLGWQINLTPAGKTHSVKIHFFMLIITFSSLVRISGHRWDTNYTYQDD